MDLYKKLNNFFVKLQNSSNKISIFGDSILDEYYNVINNRISPEFPIPVSQTTTEFPTRMTPGGAGNVYRQFANFKNIKLEYYSFLDTFAKKQYTKNGVNTKNCIVLPKNISRKKRFYNNSFPLFRWDIEQNFLEIENIEYYQNKLFESLLKSDSEICIFSDYSKGVFSDKINYNFNFSIVDPKKDPISRWKNCDVIKPNRSEALILSKKSDPVEQCLFFKENTKCKNVLITDSYKGFYGMDKNKNFFEYKSEKKSSSNVIGGGDCFIGYLSLSLLLGFDIVDSGEISFNISHYYLTNNNSESLSYLDFYRMLNVKFVDKKFLKNRDFNLIFTNGCFDAGLTPGHIDCLKFAKSQGGKVVVALNSDESIKKIKGKDRPILNLQERVEIVSHLECVDFVVSFEETTPFNLIKYMKPDIIIKGGDYKSEEIVGKDFSKVLICPKRNCISTTEKIKRLC